MILLDTNVISEQIKPSPQERPTNWLRAKKMDSLYLCNITIAELHSGLEMMPPGKRRDLIDKAIEKIEAEFDGRILAFDMKCAMRFGSVFASAKSAGNNISFADAAIAAIALANGLYLATRNIADFRSTGVTIINPWD